MKREAEPDNILSENLEVTPLKGKRTRNSRAKLLEGHTEPLSPNRSSRRSRTLSQKEENIEDPVEKDKLLPKKEKENDYIRKRKSPQKHSSRKSDQILKNFKVININRLNNLTSDDSGSGSEFEEMCYWNRLKSKRFKRSRKNGSECDTVPCYRRKSSSEIINDNCEKTIFPYKEAPATPTTPLEEARNRLHVSSVPESLPCREREFRNIFSFLENKLLDGIGGCMYISGVPGTGKTATVTQVIKKLQAMAQEGKVPEFKFIEINGMRLADPRKAYTLLWQGLSGKKEKISASQAQRRLDTWFGKMDRKEFKMPTLLVVDELDLICTKKQDVVYNLFEWPTKSPSRLIVLTIANTMDMPERLFKGKVNSRLGLTRLTFLPYSFKQLEDIVQTRLNGLNAFTLDAVKLVARKVAAVSGDARRSLDICRRATELTGAEETVKITHIEQAIREMTNSHSVKIIKSCSQLEKLFLRAVSEVSTRMGIDEVDMRDVIEHFLAVCTLEGYSRISVSDILHISNKLRCFRLLFVNHPQNGILQRLTLNVAQDDIHYGLRVDN